MSFNNFNLPIITKGADPVDVTSPSLTMEDRRLAARSRSMLFYSLCADDIIPSNDAFNIDKNLVDALESDLYNLGEMVFEITGVIRDYNERYFPRLIPSERLNQLGMVAPHQIPLDRFSHRRLTYKPNMDMTEAIRWVRGIQSVGLSTRSWIMEAAVRKAVLWPHPTMWDIQESHLRKLPHPQHFSVDTFCNKIQRIVDCRRSTLKEFKSEDDYPLYEQCARPTTPPLAVIPTSHESDEIELMQAIEELYGGPPSSRSPTPDSIMGPTLSTIRLPNQELTYSPVYQLPSQASNSSRLSLSPLNLPPLVLPPLVPPVSNFIKAELDEDEPDNLYENIDFQESKFSFSNLLQLFLNTQNRS
jgi:hypothetical protein